MPGPDLDLLLDWGRSLGVTDPPSEVHLRPWSTTVRTGKVWLKACGEGARHEAGLLGGLLWWGAPHAVLPLAVQAEQGYVALPDSGVLLRAQGRGAEPWPGLLSEHAALQRRLQRHADDAVALGVPDLRPGRLVEALPALLERRSLDQGLRAAVQQRAAALGEDAARVEAGPVAPTVQHDDLHDANVVVDAAGTARVLDWGDSSVGHPFGVLLVSLGALPEQDRDACRDAYLEAWTDLAEPAELRALAAAAERLQPLARALAWERALRTADDAERASWGDPVAGWLERLAG